MALVKDGVLLASFKQPDFVGFTIGPDCSYVVTTLNDRRIAVYNISDYKLVYDWLLKTVQNLACPAVELAGGLQFAAIIKPHLLHIWDHDELSIDKGLAINLLRPAHRLFVVKDKLRILYKDGSLGADNARLFYSSGIKLSRVEIVWCDQLKHHIVAVFRDKLCSDSEQYYVRTYDCDGMKVKTSKHQLTFGNNNAQPTTFCIQYIDDKLCLISISSNGDLQRRCLSDLSNSTDYSSILSPVSTKHLRHMSAVLALDSNQFIVVGSQVDSEHIGIGVWDSQFGIFNCWRLLPDVKQTLGQLHYCHGRLLLTSTEGIYVFSVAAASSTLLTSIGKTSCYQPGQSIVQGLPKEVTESLQMLSKPSLTPTHTAFQSQFAVLREWLLKCSPIEPLKVLPLVNAVVLRCVSEKEFWPAQELTELIQAKLIASSVCSQLCNALAVHGNIEALTTFLHCINNIPEAAVVACLSCFLSAEESKINEIMLESCNVDEVVAGDQFPSVFSQHRAHCVNLVLSLPYNEGFLLEYLHELNYTQVLNLIRHLEYLLYTTSAVELPNVNCVGRPSLSQVIDWLSLLIDAHYAQMVLSADTQQLHDRLQTALQLQREDVELMSEIDWQLLYILHGTKTVEETVGSYCIRMLHID